MNGADAPGSGRGVRWALCAVMCVWVFAFTPEPLVIATLPAMVAGLALVERCTRFRQAALHLAVVGAIAIGIGYSWLAQTVRSFGHLGVPDSWAVLALFGALGTVHGIVFAGLYRLLLRPARRPHPLVTCVLFVACEALPIRFLAWTAGNGAVDVAPLRQAAEWGGVLGVSFGLVCLVVPFHEWLRWAFGSSPGAPPARPKAALVTLLVGAAIYGAGWVRLAAVSAEEREATNGVTVGIAQGNIGSDEKREGENRGGQKAIDSRNAYRRTTAKCVEKGAELIVWPESVIDGTAGDSIRVWNPLARRPRDPSAIQADLARLGYGYVEEFGRDRAILLGGWEHERRPENVVGAITTDRYNAAMLREAGGREWSLYRKVKLIPFGEWMPLSDLIPSLKGMLPQQAPVTAGTLPQPPLLWKARNLRIATFICYEAIFPGFVRELVGDERPDLLVNLTNDSWYGDTWEPMQHLNFSRLRAVEHRCPMVRATNTGISAFVDSTGEVIDRLPYDTKGALVRRLPLVPREPTPFERFGHLAPWALWAFSLLAVLGARLRPARRAA